MAISETAQLAGYGFPYPLAVETLRQIDAGIGNGDGRRLMALGMPQPAARIIANSVNDGGLPPLGPLKRLVATGMYPLAARVLVTAFAT